MSKIFIAGGAGFIGAHLSRKFLDADHEVYVFDFNIQYFYPLSPESIKNMSYRHGVLLKGASLIRGNVNDPNDVRRKIMNIKPDYIINLASLPLAVTAIENSEEAYASIIHGTESFMEILRDVDFVIKYIHVSSSMVYGDFEHIPNPEDARKEPKDIYGSFKLASEYLVKGYAQRHQIPYAIIRPSAVYGPTDNNKRVLQNFIENAMKGKPIVVKNPKQQLDFTFVEDTAQGIKDITLSPDAVDQAFNVTRGEGRGLCEAIEILREYFPALEVLVEQADGFYPRRGALDIQKAKKIAAYEPSFTLERGIKEYIHYLQAKSYEDSVYSGNRFSSQVCY